MEPTRGGIKGGVVRDIEKNHLVVTMLRTIEVPFGDGQPSLRIQSDGESITLTCGLPDPWRASRDRITIPSELAVLIADALLDVVKV